MLDPITKYELDKAKHREYEAEFERYWDKQLNDVGLSEMPTTYRLILGVGSIALGALLIVQMVIG